MRADIYERAVELDDDQPDHVCPGCHQNIAGWGAHEGHYEPDRVNARRRSTWMSGAANWAEQKKIAADWCPWTRDHLAARKFRRDYIVRWRAQVAPSGAARPTEHHSPGVRVEDGHQPRVDSSGTTPPRTVATGTAGEGVAVAGSDRPLASNLWPLYDDCGRYMEADT